MWAQLLIFVIKVLIGTTLGVFGIYGFNKKKKMDRIFDTLTSDVQCDILETCIAYAKAELPPNTDLIEYAVGFGEMFFLEETDFSILSALELDAIDSWTGSRPPHKPKTW